MRLGAGLVARPCLFSRSQPQTSRLTPGETQCYLAPDVEARTTLEQAVGAALALGGPSLYAWLLHSVRRTLRTVSGAWWASSLRDLANLAGAGFVLSGLYLFGFAVHLAILLGCLLALAVYAADYGLALRAQRPPLLVMPLGVALALSLLLFAQEIAPVVDRVLNRLFQGL
jgi:hypothetical protein